MRRGIGMLLQAGIPRARRSREPTADIILLLFPALWAAVVRLSLHHEKRHPINGAFSRGGAKGIRTPDLLNAIQTRYQLRYNPVDKIIIQGNGQKIKRFYRPIC